MPRTAESTELGTVYLLAAIAEQRDGERHAHTLRVARAAALLAIEIGLPAEEVELIRLAVPLHDIGKLGVADAILSKPGPLDDWELAQMRRHPEIGRQVLAGSDLTLLRLAAVVAHTHHEWWDGRGYPQGLEEERIPLAGRITAVADAFDAMTHSRPYKDAWPVDQALAELELCAGAQFDPWLVQAFDDLDHGSLLGPADRIREPGAGAWQQPQERPAPTAPA